MYQLFVNLPNDEALKRLTQLERPLGDTIHITSVKYNRDWAGTPYLSFASDALSDTGVLDVIETVCSSRLNVPYKVLKSLARPEM